MSDTAGRPKTRKSSFRTDIPRVLPNFGKVYGLYRCPRCCCTYIGISERGAAAYVKDRRAFYATLEPDERADFVTPEGLSLEPYTRCFNCKLAVKHLVKIPDDENVPDFSPQLVIVHE